MSRTALSYAKKDYLKSFKAKNPGIKVPDKMVYEILDIGGQVCADKLLEEGSLKLASRLGDINVRKFKPHGKGFGIAMDKHKSKTLRKPIFQFNDHTGGWMYRFFWNRHKCKGITDKNMWVFKPIRSLKRALAVVLKGKITDYPILSKETN